MLKMLKVLKMSQLRYEEDFKIVKTWTSSK
jgi:hypothetical protein